MNEQPNEHAQRRREFSTEIAYLESCAAGTCACLAAVLIRHVLGVCAIIVLHTPVLHQIYKKRSHGSGYASRENYNGHGATILAGMI